MKFPELLQRATNTLLHPLGYQLRRLPREQVPMTMGGAIRRASERGIEVGSVIDVGAANGEWARFAMRHYPDARYLLVDPLEERRSALETLRAERPNVDFVIAAAGEAAGEVDFAVCKDLDSSGVFEEPNQQTRRVPVITLDAEIARLALPPPYFLKLDTHGYEVPILAGAARTLEQTGLLVVEAYNFPLTSRCLRFQEMIAHLETLGFRCCEVVDPVLRPRDKVLWQMDLFFLPKSSPFFRDARFG